KRWKRWKLFKLHIHLDKLKKRSAARCDVLFGISRLNSYASRTLMRFHIPDSIMPPSGIGIEFGE
ncbi:MAG: hypothetical protein OSA93_15575, partial [Akkermansiaceae bacterium]|nr:hypothetical protein [Akkermansiaceae bacterium]